MSTGAQYPGRLPAESSPLGRLGGPNASDAGPGTPPPREARLGYLDNLRWTMIVLVVAFHTAITYSHIGAWYYSDPKPVGQVSSLVFLTFEVHCQAFFMGILFLLAGYFVPGAFDRKGFRRFMADRFVRLGLPSLIYIFVLQPGLMHYLLGAGKGSLADYYRTFLAAGDWLTGSGPMWFAIALMLFCLGYGVVRMIVPPKGKARRGAPTRPGEADGAEPVNGLGDELLPGAGSGVIEY